MDSADKTRQNKLKKTTAALLELCLAIVVQIIIGIWPRTISEMPNGNFFTIEDDLREVIRVLCNKKIADATFYGISIIRVPKCFVDSAVNFEKDLLEWFDADWKNGPIAVINFRDLSSVFRKLLQRSMSEYFKFFRRDSTGACSPLDNLVNFRVFL